VAVTTLNKSGANSILAGLNLNGALVAIKRNKTQIFKAYSNPYCCIIYWSTQSCNSKAQEVSPRFASFKNWCSAQTNNIMPIWPKKLEQKIKTWLKKQKIGTANPFED
jgi:hypothetical protein